MSWDRATAAPAPLAGEQRQLHAALTLGHAIAHGGHAAGELRHGTRVPRRLFDQRGETLEGLMGAQHVVIGGDDGDVGFDVAGEVLLVGRATGGEAVGEIAAGQFAPLRPAPCRLAVIR
jgi:hypothetical protein